MKKFYLTFSITVFLLVCSNGIQAQTAQTKLNQVELMKQNLGSWKVDLGNGGTFFWNVEAYGSGIETKLEVVVNGEIRFEGKQLMGYDKKLDKYIVAQLTKGQDIIIWATWFISENKYLWIPYDDISNPDNASIHIVGEFKSPSVFIETRKEINKPVRILTYTRVN